VEPRFWLEAPGRGGANVPESKDGALLSSAASPRPAPLPALPPAKPRAGEAKQQLCSSQCKFNT